MGLGIRRCAAPALSAGLSGRGTTQDLSPLKRVLARFMGKPEGHA